jgi:hypothetical protein
MLSEKFRYNYFAKFCKINVNFVSISCFAKEKIDVRIHPKTNTVSREKYRVTVNLTVIFRNKPYKGQPHEILEAFLLIR